MTNFPSLYGPRGISATEILEAKLDGRSIPGAQFEWVLRAGEILRDMASAVSFAWGQVEIELMRDYGDKLLRDVIAEFLKIVRSCRPIKWRAYQAEWHESLRKRACVGAPAMRLRRVRQ